MFCPHLTVFLTACLRSDGWSDLLYCCIFHYVCLSFSRTLFVYCVVLFRLDPQENILFMVVDFFVLTNLVSCLSFAPSLHHCCNDVEHFILKH